VNWLLLTALSGRSDMIKQYVAGIMVMRLKVNEMKNRFKLYEMTVLADFKTPLNVCPLFFPFDNSKRKSLKCWKPLL